MAQRNSESTKAIMEGSSRMHTHTSISLPAASLLLLMLMLCSALLPPASAQLSNSTVGFGYKGSARVVNSTEYSDVIVIFKVKPIPHVFNRNSKSLSLPVCHYPGDCTVLRRTLKAFCLFEQCVQNPRQCFFCEPLPLGFQRIATCQGCVGMSTLRRCLAFLGDCQTNS